MNRSMMKNDWFNFITFFVEHTILKYDVTFEVVMAPNTNIAVVWVVAPCSFIQHTIWKIMEVARTYETFEKFLSECTVLQPRRQTYIKFLTNLYIQNVTVKFISTIEV